MAFTPFLLILTPGKKLETSEKETGLEIKNESIFEMRRISAFAEPLPRLDTTRLYYNRSILRLNMKIFKRGGLFFTFFLHGRCLQYDKSDIVFGI